MRFFAVASLVAIAGCSQPSASGHETTGNAIISVPAASKPAGGAGPFGIDAGMKLNALSTDGERDAETGISILTAAPKPSSQFPNVAVVSFPETGICEIRSSSNDFDSDSHLVSSTSFVDEVAGALKAKYGDTKVDNGCSGYSCNSDYKLQAVQDGSRWYRYTWKSDEGRKLPNGVKEIYLYVTHAQFNDSRVRLDYVFDNTQSCEAAAKGAKASNL